MEERKVYAPGSPPVTVSNFHLQDNNLEDEIYEEKQIHSNDLNLSLTFKNEEKRIGIRLSDGHDEIETESEKEIYSLNTATNSFTISTE